MSSSAIFVENLSKKFARNLYRGMWYGLNDSLKAFLGRTPQASLRPAEFYALKNINFEVAHGEAVGILGANGSGKSTLLRLINGIFPPDEGYIKVCGRIGSLIALGAGFHPHMTGRENIYLNGMILGASRAEIEARFHDIVEFAEMGSFLDAPVATYSSGMRVRLGFAVAIHITPDILVIDEVLAVGDMRFQKRCLDKLLELRAQGVTTLVVSHSLPTLEQMCTTGLVLHEGIPLYFGPIREAVKRYVDNLYTREIILDGGTLLYGSGNVQISDVSVRGVTRGEIGVIEVGEDIQIEFGYRFREKLGNRYQLRITLRTSEGREIQKFIYNESDFLESGFYEDEPLIEMKSVGRVRLTINSPFLFPQSVRMDVAVQRAQAPFHEAALVNATVFKVIEPQNKKVYFEYGNMTITNFPSTIEMFGE